MQNQRDPRDALNHYLDECVSAPRPDACATDLAPGLRDDVDRFIDLAQRASMVSTNLRRPPMNTIVSTNSVLPASKRTDPHHPLAKRMNTPTSLAPRDRLNIWLSAALVALMFLGLAGGAWWLGPGRGSPSDDAPLRVAALTPDEGTPTANWPEPLTPDEAPWITAISPEECTVEPMSYEEYATAKTTDPGPPQGSYEIIGVPEPAGAQAVVTVLRAWLACADTNNISAIRAYSTNDFIFFSDFTADNAPYRAELDRRRADAQRQWSQWARTNDLDPISVVEGIEPPAEAIEIFAFAQAVLDGEETYISPDQRPITYFEARFDPADAVLLADERIMIPTHYIYWADDPWVQEHGFSPDPNMQVMAVILENVDGEWKIDESSISQCLGECDAVLASGTPALDATPVATPED